MDFLNENQPPTILDILLTLGEWRGSPIHIIRVGRNNIMSGTHGEMVGGVSDVVERVGVIANDGAVGQRVVHDVV